MMIWWHNTDPTATCSIQVPIRRSSRRKSPYAGSLIVVSQGAQICRNVYMAIRTVCSSTSTSKLYWITSTSTKKVCIWGYHNIYHKLSAVKIFAVSDNENLWLLRHVLGIPSVRTMLENRRRKFYMVIFWMMTYLLLYFSVMTFNVL